MASLVRRRVLVVEDEYFIADDLVQALRAAGAEVLGPAGTVDEAHALLADGKPDLAVLDINLSGDMSFEIADTLVERGVAFIFATGYDDKTVPPRHRTQVLLKKPSGSAEIVAALERLPTAD